MVRFIYIGKVEDEVEKAEKIIISPVTSVLSLIIIFVFVIHWNNPSYFLIGVTIFYVLGTLLCLLTEVIKKSIKVVIDYA